MDKNLLNEEILWKDRKHHLWFPFSFTKYQLAPDRLYSQSGFFNTHYDELLLYRIVDICLQRNLGQKICGTGTIVLAAKADTQGVLKLENIKHPMEIKRLLSDKIEESRRTTHVVGKEFFGSGSLHGPHDDMEEGQEDMDHANVSENYDDDVPGFDFNHLQ